MRFFTDILSAIDAKFIFKHSLIGLAKASGYAIQAPRNKQRNIQCVKLTKHHQSVLQMVVYWCSLRINTLQQKGISDETLRSLRQHDARFLTCLSHALTVQADPDPAFDAWLIFNEDAQSTDFFELQHCARNTKVTKASFVIQADR